MTEAKGSQPSGEKQEPKLTKEELFKQEPDNFFYKDDIALGVITNEEGGILVQARPMTPKEMGGFLFILQHHCSKAFYAIEAMFEKRSQSGIIKSATDLNNKKGFRSFIRGKK